MDTKVYIVRHGQTDWNKKKHVQGRTNIDLNKDGVKEAYDNANNFDGIKINKIISSPLNRAYDTAKIFKEVNKWNLDIIKDERIIERSFGDKEGLHVSKAFKEKLTTENTKDFETDEILVNRVKEVIEENNDNDCVLFAHSHVLKAALVAYDDTITFHGTYLPNCSIIVINFKNKLFDSITYLNCKLEYHNSSSV